MFGSKLPSSTSLRRTASFRSMASLDESETKEWHQHDVETADDAGTVLPLASTSLGKRAKSWSGRGGSPPETGRGAPTRARGDASDLPPPPPPPHSSAHAGPFARVAGSVVSRNLLRAAILSVCGAAPGRAARNYAVMASFNEDPADRAAELERMLVGHECTLETAFGFYTFRDQRRYAIGDYKGAHEAWKTLHETNHHERADGPGLVSRWKSAGRRAAIYWLPLSTPQQFCGAPARGGPGPFQPGRDLWETGAVLGRGEGLLSRRIWTRAPTCKSGETLYSTWVATRRSRAFIWMRWRRSRRS